MITPYHTQQDLTAATSNGQPAGMQDLYGAGLEDGVSGRSAQQSEPDYLQGYQEGKGRRRNFQRLRYAGKGFYEAAAAAHLTHEQAEGVH